MPEPQTLDTRIISRKGLVRVPTDKISLGRYYLYADIVRPPTQRYLNRTYTPERGFFARINVMLKDAVVQELTVNYESQLFIFDADLGAQNLIGLQCSYAGILESFKNLGIALNLNITDYQDKIKDWKPFPLNFDEFRIFMYGDTAYKFVLTGIPFEKCKEDEPTRQPPPSPPPKPTTVPPGTPVEVSPPHDEVGQDDVTDPFPGDNFPDPDPPQGDSCQRLVITVVYKRVNGIGQPTSNGTISVEILGPVNGVRSARPVIIAKCGAASFDGPCDNPPTDKAIIFNNSIAPGSDSVISFSVVPA